MKFANFKYSCFNWTMKSLASNIKEKMISKYYENSTPLKQSKSTDINVLLNRVKTNQKMESRKKLYFSAAASTGLLLFVFIIF